MTGYILLATRLQSGVSLKLSWAAELIALDLQSERYICNALLAGLLKIKVSDR